MNLLENPHLFKKETLKLLSKVFNVSINALLGSPRKLVCQCCGMPLEDSIMSKEPNGEFNEDFCQWCYHDGQYTYHDKKTLIDVCVQHMVSDQFNEQQVREYMSQLLPTLKYWKENN